MLFDPKKHLWFTTRKTAQFFIDNTIRPKYPNHVIFPYKLKHKKIYAIHMDGAKFLTKQDC